MTALPSLIVVSIAAVCNANMDGLQHYKESIIWQRWDTALTRWMLRGSNARASIPAWVKRVGPLYSLVKAFWDGWHGSKTTMFLLLLAVYPLTITDPCQVLLAVPVFQAVWYLWYHIILPR